jgi:hypothetical protein
MYKSILTLLLWFPFIVWSQNDTQPATWDVSAGKSEEIESFFNVYLEDTRKMDWDKVLDKTHPGLIKLTTREQMKSQLDQALNNYLYTTTFDEMRFNNISKSIVFNGVYYYQIDYYSAFTFHFIKDEKQTQEEHDNYISFMTSIYANQFSDMQVTQNASDIKIEGDKKILLIEDASLDGMKMLELKPELQMYLTMFIPEVVVNEFLESN